MCSLFLCRNHLPEISGADGKGFAVLGLPFLKSYLHLKKPDYIKGGKPLRDLGGKSQE